MYIYIATCTCIQTYMYIYIFSYVHMRCDVSGMCERGVYVYKYISALTDMGWLRVVGSLKL